MHWDSKHMVLTVVYCVTYHVIVFTACSVKLLFTSTVLYIAQGSIIKFSSLKEWRGSCDKWRHNTDHRPSCFEGKCKHSRPQSPHMAYFRNDSWTEDLTLKEELSKFVRQGLQRQEILSFLARDFPLYAWSIRTLDRRLHHLDIYWQWHKCHGWPYIAE